MFSSNLKSLSELVENVEIDFNSYEDYLNYGVVPSPKTIYKNIFKLNRDNISNSIYLEILEKLAIGFIGI